LCKEVPPKPPSRNSIALGFPAFLVEESGKTQEARSFWRGVWGETIFKKVLLRFLL
jgi:hypothetical protein